MESPSILFVFGVLIYVTIFLWPERIVFGRQMVTAKKTLFKSESYPLADLSEIHFHYHAAIGFECQWEFIFAQGQSLTLNSLLISRKFVLAMERHIPRFSAAEFYKEFEQGDIVDSLLIWSANRSEERTPNEQTGRLS